LLGRAEIEALIPHADDMVLLDSVLSFDEKSILCRTTSHGRADNPLRVDGGLPAVCGAEYGAQAAAIHGPVVAGGKERAGQVVFLRDIVWRVPDLSVFDDPILVRAECLHKDAKGMAYGFTLSVRDREILSGECGIILG